MKALFRPDLPPDRPAARDAFALTFDDGPCPTATPEVLDVLGERGAAATFFMIGERVRLWPDLARRVLREGHQVANHSSRHAAFRSLVPAVGLGEAEKARRSFQSVLGVAPRFYRPPKGLLDPWAARALRRAGYDVTTWSLMPGDYFRWHTPAWIKRRLDSVKPGDIVVLHDGLGLRPEPDRRRMLRVLTGWLQEITDKGLRLVTLAELLGRPAYFPTVPAQGDGSRWST